MQFKTFSGKTASQVLSKIRTILGPDAIILDTSEEGGVVTMTAALKRTQAVGSSDVSVSTEADVMEKEPVAAAAPSTPAPPPQWENEWENIKGHLMTLLKPTMDLERLPSTQRVAIEFLQKEDVRDETVLSLFNQLQNNPSASILQLLGSMVPIVPWGSKGWPEPVHVLAGPFGVGKTSVVIRLALLYRKEFNSAKICVINGDSSRGNGRLLLKHYCELSDIVYKEAATSVELANILRLAKEDKFDRIFIDLPGLSRGSFLQDLLDDAGMGASMAGGLAVHTVYPPYLAQIHYKTFVKRYYTSHRGSLIWTKLDESEHYGSIINIGVQTRLPISALSFGPGFGSSLAPASPSAVWRLMFKRELPSVTQG